MAKKRKGRKQTIESAPPASKKSGGRGTWRVMDRGSALMAGLLAQRVSAVAWRAATGRKPPVNGQHPDVGTREAIAWAVIGGAVIELVKVGVRRWTAVYWVRSTGKLPPGMKPLPDSAQKKEPVPTEPAPLPASNTKVSRRSRGR